MSATDPGRRADRRASGESSFAENVDQVRRRYRAVAVLYPLFEIALALPPGARDRAVAALALPDGGSVLEVGCGTGRNLARLRSAVGPDGHVAG